MFAARSPKKDRIPKPVREAMHVMVQEYGPQRLAGLTGQSPAVISNKANPNGKTTPHLPTLDDVLTWMLFTHDFRPLLAINQACGHVAFPLPDLSSVSDAALLEHVAKIGKEGGDFHAALSRALQDKRFRADEVTRIEEEAYQWIAAIHEACARMRGMVDA